MLGCIDYVNRIVWGAPALVLILGVGLLLSMVTGFVQIRMFPHAVKHFWDKFRHGPSENGISPFQAFCTALGATVGTGNLVGVAGAIAIGGPGSIFWMWICAILGMATKFAEAALAVHYRIRERGEYRAGPMYIITRGLEKKWHWMASCYCLFGVIAAFGVGNGVQIRAVISGMNGVIGFFGGSQTLKGDLLMGLLLALLVGAMLLGGARRIGQTAELLMPVVSGCYLALCIGVLVLRFDAIPGAFRAIVTGAFSTKSVTGGLVGSSFLALRVGVSRGVFTNEAGMGTASIAHGTAQVQHPAQQGLMGIMEVFLDTILICTMTALVILCSGVPIPYGVDAGAELTAAAFASTYGPWIKLFLALALCCFAFATVLGWGLYGARCAQFLFGDRAWKIFALLEAFAAFLSALLNTSTIWTLSETVNGLMAIPNLIALVMLAPQLRKLTLEYKDLCGNCAAGGTYENFHQCQPLSAVPHAEISSLRTGSQAAGQENLSSEHRSAGSAYPPGLF